MDRIAQLKAFLEKNPKDNFLRHALALEYVKLGDEQTAKSYFEENISLNKEYVASYYHLGKLLERIGDEDAAIAIYASGMEVAKSINDKHSFSELRSVYEELTF